ncbi:NACHT domain-containing protein [Fusarium pseudocircinatum]|uniref:NACHT domain-containing protein n=1 Tax=Fusarium pseudocircinatum TaxID=56676 RepID=A0A8H5KHN9_9HYPO|nr:NACHT domain-containing protein [Fusarium pseudocircinatum]
MDLAQSSQAVTSSIPKKGDHILQNAIDSFRTVLTPEQLAEFDCIRSVPDTDAVLVFTAELDLQRQNHKGKSIASRLYPVLQAVHNFTSIIDTFVSSNPTIAALVWGSVKMTMMIMLNAAPYYEAFVELCMELGTICPRFEQYQALFPASERLKEALCTFNAAIIQCCRRVIAMPKSSIGWTSPLNPLNPSFWQSFKQTFDSDLQKLRDHSKNVNKEIRLAADQSQHRNNELQRLENEQADRSRRSLSRFMSRTRDDFDTMHRLQIMRREELEREDNQKLLDSFCSYDYIKPLKQARQKRYPRSAEWIFRTDEFKRWADGTTPGLLWCSGKMGSGKSIVSPESHVTFFFSRFDDSESMRAETILRALSRQLVTIQDVSGPPKQALETLQFASEDISSGLSQLLTRLLSRKGPPSWVILDGIDECEREERQILIKVLRSTLDKGVNARLFITSRDHTNSILEGAFVKLEQVFMNCPLAQDSMAQLVDQAVQKCLDAEELLVSDQKLIAEIKKTLAKHADGMILWVTLILRHLCSQPNNESIREAITFKNLPRSLTEIFNRILDRTISEEKDSIVQRLLLWIVAAKQPLTLSQLEECCLIKPLQECITRDRYVNGIHLIDNWFQGLVEIDYETKTVHFIHACVHQFFLTASDKPAFSNFHIHIQDADRHIGEVCVTYLNFSDFKTTLARVRPPLPPIAPDEICQKALSNEWSWPKILRLSQRIHGHQRRAAYIDATIVSCTRAPDVTVQETMILKHPFLAYASAYWLSHSANFDPEHCQTWSLWKNMLMCGHELSASPVSEEHHRTIDEALILWATQTRHSAIFHVVATSMELIEHYHEAIFAYILEESNINLLRRLLNTKNWGQELNSLCCRAAYNGRLEIVKTLSEAGVNINMPEFGEASNIWELSVPLQEAVAEGHIKVIEYLLQQGADPNLRIMPFQSRPLELAATLGGWKGLQSCNLLINAGANVRNTTVLLRSCLRGDREIIKLLLSADADVNALYPASQWKPPSDDAFAHEGSTALLGAFSIPKPEVDIIELLIEAGAKVDIGSSQDSGYRLLREAIRSRDCNLVKILMREGADPNGRPGLDPDYTPLALAAVDGSFEIMHYLLSTGARVVGFELIAARIPVHFKSGKEYDELLAALQQADQL